MNSRNPFPEWFGLLAVLLLVAAVASACTRENPKPAPKEFELGAHRVQVTVPPGWEALDQGKQKRFRKGELEIVLQNLGPDEPFGGAPRQPRVGVEREWVTTSGAK